MPTATLQKSEFRFSFKAALGAIDAAKGRMTDVSLMTEGEAAGHGCWCDTKTLQSVFACAQKSPVKAYLTHGSFFQPDRLGEEMGLFSGLYIEGNQIKARQFVFFKSFRDGQPQKYAAIMELAAADPSLFGVSLSFSGQLAWAMPDGTDLPCEDDGDMPEGALFGMPAVRVEKVFSADLVGDPAANANGLFSERAKAAAEILGIKLPALSPSPLTKSTPPAPAAKVDAPALSKPQPNFTMLKDLMTAFPDSAQFSRACALLAADDKLTVADISAKLAAEKEVARVAGIEADLAAIKATLAAKDAEIVQLKADVAAAGKGADPIALGSGDIAPVDPDTVVANYLKLSGDEAGRYLAKHIGTINAQRKLHGTRGKFA